MIAAFHLLGDFLLPMERRWLDYIILTKRLIVLVLVPGAKMVPAKKIIVVTLLCRAVPGFD